MMRRRATPSAARPSTWYPKASGPRCCSAATMRSSTARSATVPVGARKPAMPHIASGRLCAERSGRGFRLAGEQQQTERGPGELSDAAHEPEGEPRCGPEAERDEGGDGAPFLDAEIHWQEERREADPGPERLDHERRADRDRG